MCTPHGFLPTAIEGVTTFCRHLRGILALKTPVGNELALIFPVPHGESCQIRGTQGGSFDHLRPLHRHLEDIALELHGEVIHGGSTIDAYYWYCHA
jgi:hypothetical protein